MSLVSCLNKKKKPTITRYRKILLSRVNSPMRKASIIWDAAILRSPQDYIPRRLLNRQTMNRGLVGNRVGDGVLEVTVESGTLAYSQKDMKPERSSKRGRLSRDYFKNTRRSIRSRKELHRTQSHFSRWEAQ